MDFILEQELSELFRDMGVATHDESETYALLEMDAQHAGVRDCLCVADQTCDVKDGWNCRAMDMDQLITSIVSTIHKIHEGQTVMIPAGRWRSMFDAVAYSMAEDEPWQEFDASATIRLNTKDPLVFESGDEHTLANLLTALMKDGETIEQSVFLIPAGAPLLMHICPCGPVKLWFGNSALADEVSEVYAV